LTRTPEGLPHLIVGAALDVTDLRETEAALRASEARYREVVESQAEMICRYLPETLTLTFVNEAYCRAAGKTREELLGRTALNLVSDEDRDRLIVYLRSLAANPRFAEIEHGVKLPDGTIGRHVWADYPTFHPDGPVVQFQWICENV